MTPGETPRDTTPAVSNTQTVNGHWRKWCLACEEWIGLGPKGSEHTFVAHQDSKQCQRTRDQKAHAEAREALKTLKPSFSTIPYALPPASQNDQEIPSSGSSPLPPLLAPSVALPNSAALATSNLFFLAPPPPSPVVFPPLLAPGLSSGGLLTMDGLTSPPTSPGPSLTSPVSSHLPSSASTSHTSEPCNGVPFKWEHGSVFLSYPLQYHETGCPTWSVDGIGETESSHSIRLRSHSCTHFREHSMEACLPCTNLVSSPKFQNMLKNASQDPSPNTPYLYLSWKQIVTKLRSTAKELQQERKEV